MLTLLRKTKKTYAGRHADDHRAPTGTKCVGCGAAEPPAGVLGEDLPTLARCSICAAWLCSGACFSLHRAPKGYGEDTRAPWWKRVTGRG